jgi:hypothetical protein
MEYRKRNPEKFKLPKELEDSLRNERMFPYDIRKPVPPPKDKKSEQGAPLPTNPVSEVEGLTGVRMTKGQKWAAVIGITLALYGVTIYLNKK